jgi:hypothetical protein
MALELPRKAEREYITASGIVSVYVAALPSGRALVGLSRDLLHTLLAVRRRFSGAHIATAFWVQDKPTARLIARQVNADLAFLQPSARTAQRKVENVAAHMGIALTEHATVLARTRSAVAFVEERIAEAEAHGELSWFNSAYRDWRLEAKRHGRGMSYAEARARLRQKIFRAILTSDDQITPNSVFPPLPGIDFPVPG